MRITACTALVLLAACSAGAPVNSDFDPRADFSAYGTFRVVEPAVILPVGASRLPPDIHDAIFGTIRAELRARSLRETPTGADLSVVVTVRVADETGTDTWSPRWDATGDRLDGGTYEFREGTLIVDLNDTATGQLVWRGWAHGAVDRTDGYDPALLQRVVQEILARYPPAPED